MKRNRHLFLGALVVLGLGETQLPTALAQMYGAPTAGEKDANKASDQAKDEAPSAEAGAKMTESLAAAFPGAKVVASKKLSSAGTNDIYGVQFTAQPGKMRGIIATDGTILETEEPADINTFPGPANNAVRKAITGMGVKDLGVRLGRTYGEVRTGSS